MSEADLLEAIVIGQRGDELAKCQNGKLQPEDAGKREEGLSRLRRLIRN